MSMEEEKKGECHDSTHSYGKLTITVESAHATRDMDKFSKNDPFVEYQVPGTDLFTTKVLEDKGRDAVWGESQTIDITEDNFNNGFALKLMEDDGNTFGGDKVNAQCNVQMRELLGKNMTGHGKKEYKITYSNKKKVYDGGHIVLSTKFVPSWYITGGKSEQLHKDLVEH